LKKRWDVVWIVFCTIRGFSFPSVDDFFGSNRFRTREAARLAVKDFMKIKRKYIKIARFKYYVRKYVKA
jgi:hypothetical protein